MSRHLAIKLKRSDRMIKMKKCKYCKSKENLTIDHKIPISRGGTDDPSNLQCLCKKCNMMKSGMLDSEIKRVIKYFLEVKGIRWQEYREFIKQNKLNSSATPFSKANL